MRYKLLFVKALLKQLRKLTIITKQLIAIIIANFKANKLLIAIKSKRFAITAYFYP